MKKKNHVRKQGIAALLAAAVTVGGLPNGYVYAMPGQPVEALGAETEPDTALPAEDAPVYRLVKKGEPSASGYQAMVWVDEAGNEVEGMSFYDEPVPYRVREALPSRYNMADQEELPAVRNQGKWGTCWAHAAIASVETNMVKKGLANATGVDYSERHLSYFAHRRNEALGDGEDSPSEGYGWYGGGNYYQALAAFSNWNGAASEEKYPYVSYGDMAELDESDRMSSVSHVTDASFLNTAEDVKRAVMETGAVMCSFYTGDGTVASAQEFVYHAEKHAVDHSVNIVGWDDNYDKSVFHDKENNGDRQPEQNGAWLCRNSWGENWAQEGYFWISYEDATLGEFCSFQAEGPDNYDNIYSYDGAVAPGFIGYDKSANIFCTKQAEELKAVSVIANKNYNYRIEIYADRDGAMQVPSDGALVCSQEGSLSYPGYHTISLENSVILDAGMKYAVAVQFLSKEVGEPASSYLEWGDKYSSGSGQSFFYTGNGWQATEEFKAGYHNVYVKAFTDDTRGVDVSRISALLTEIGALKEEEYTAASWENLQAAAETARGDLSGTLTEQEIVRILLDLQAAQAALKPVTVTVANEAEFEAFAATVNGGDDYSGQTVRLLNDLDMTGITHTAVGSWDTHPFQGTFDGDGHEIANLRYESNGSYGGLFGVIGEGGVVGNFRLSGADMKFGASFSGAIAGLNKGMIRDCSVEGNLLFDVDSGAIGGLAGTNDGRVESSSVNGTVTFQKQKEQDRFVGGIVGSNNGSVAKCSMEGEIVSDSAASVGGIVGYGGEGSEVRLCRNLASIGGSPASAVWTAGIGVCLYGETYGCYNFGTITRASAGGDETAAVYCQLGDVDDISNCYYLDTSCARGGFLPASSEGSAPEEEFALGKVAHDLNTAGGTVENTREWSQKDGLPIVADGQNAAVVKISVRQAEGNKVQVYVNGVTEGAFYANGGSFAEISFSGGEPDAGYAFRAEVEGLLSSGETGGYLLPGQDAEIFAAVRQTLVDYKIIWHLNGGRAELPESYNVETAAQFPEPTKREIKFLGWYDNAQFSGDPVSGIERGTTGDKEYWAKWNNPGFEVVFPENDGYEIVTASGSEENGSIRANGSYCFTVRAADGYDVSEITIRRGQETLAAENGEYRVDGITSDIEDIEIEGLKLAAGNYEVEKSENGYVGKTAVIRPSLPAVKIRLKGETEFADQITVETESDVSIVVSDGGGTENGGETVSFDKRDITAPMIQFVQALPPDGAEVVRYMFIMADAQDEESGIGGYSFDGGATWQDSQTYLLECQEEESVFDNEILVRDRVGNISRHTGRITIPAAGKYGCMTLLQPQKAAYTYGETVTLLAGVWFNDAGEETGICGTVTFFMNGDSIGTADVQAVETENQQEGSALMGLASLEADPAIYESVGKKTFQAKFNGHGTPYQDSESSACDVQIEKYVVAFPGFEDAEVEAGSLSAAGAADLEDALPASGMLALAGNLKISFEIAWDEGQTIDLTAPGSEMEFTGTLAFPGLPEWAALPDNLRVTRKVKVVGTQIAPPDEGDPPDDPVTDPPDDPVTDPSEDPEKGPSDDPSKNLPQEPEFKKGAKEDSKNGRYQVIDAKKKTAALAAVINKKATKFEVPDTVTICGQKCKVVEIKANVFKGGSKLKKLILGKNVAKIGKNAFMNCKKLNSIQLKGKALKSVQKGAFSKTASKITVKTKKLTKKQKDALKKALRKGGISSKVKI